MSSKDGIQLNTIFTLQLNKKYGEIMNKYLVTFRSVDYFVYEVEANDEDEAYELAQDGVSSGALNHLDHWCESYEEFSIEEKKGDV